MAKKVTAEVIKGFIQRLEECAADAVEITELVRKGQIELEAGPESATSVIFDVAAATRDITQMGITVSAFLRQERRKTQ